jgi:hypothetical protein
VGRSEAVPESRRQNSRIQKAETQRTLKPRATPAPTKTQPVPNRLSQRLIQTALIPLVILRSSPSVLHLKEDATCTTVVADPTQELRQLEVGLWLELPLATEPLDPRP